MDGDVHGSLNVGCFELVSASHVKTDFVTGAAAGNFLPTNAGVLSSRRSAVHSSGPLPVVAWGESMPIRDRSRIAFSASSCVPTSVSSSFQGNTQPKYPVKLDPSPYSKLTAPSRCRLAKATRFRRSTTHSPSLRRRLSSLASTDLSHCQVRRSGVFDIDRLTAPLSLLAPHALSLRAKPVPLAAGARAHPYL